MASFVPRIVQSKTTQTDTKRGEKKQEPGARRTVKSEIVVIDLRGKDSALDSPETDHHDNSDDEQVLSYSKQQRWPNHGEPVCVVCGRYGAYICSQTEKDVCSLECKARHLKLCGIPVDMVDNSPPHRLDETQRGNNSDHSYIYSEHPTITNLTITQVEQLRKQLEIQVQGVDVSRPILDFIHGQFNETLSTNISNCGYHSPTPVQMQLIPVALSGRDVVACACTGSGKTAAFLLPMIARIHHITGILSAKSKLLCHPLGLILAPTRELCMQIEHQAKELIQGLANMRTALLVGGVPLPQQLHRLQTGVQIIIATPGRLLEILSRDHLDMTNIKYFVLDEVDSMLQLGFDLQVQEILEKLNHDRQSVVLSATIPKVVENMTSKLTHNPVYILVGSACTPTQAVKQLVLWVEEKAKKKYLFSILMDPKHYQPPLVVFVDSRIGADMLAEAVQKVCSIPCVAMHADKEQNERTLILKSFIEGRYPVIVCTGILGRGIDLLNVKQVINFDMPPTIDEYIHQVGRAGRLGNRGVALTFINNNNRHLFLDLLDTLTPLAVKLPTELTNSFYVKQQIAQRTRGTKRRERDDIVSQGNLMDMLKKRSTRRRKK